MAAPPADSHPIHVSLREITGKNLRAVLALDVTEDQKQVYPRSNAYSIAEGHYPPDDDPVWIRAIYAGETPVGFLMTSEAPDQGVYFLWRLMVDATYQGKGYGYRAVELLIERIKASPNAKELITSHLKQDGNAGGFYQHLGFEYTGEVINGDDHVMKIGFLGQ
ncbi:MAG: GNAT family N-acetyltransferase [Pseudomonadales bacterium]|jgi:diamine N-acetyltransferase|nr:GNAT family N-acetyltransferase [Pseudomonadales bacterium]HJN52584.1 GNAT family N-acetyltransferase [Pseudomonadales bacterium]|tara:strand:+ start:6475 stop:6966 length:492 start_codon:yes stop_codon:yes gene_type:complete